MDLELKKVINDEERVKNEDKEFLDKMDSELKIDMNERQIVSNEEWLDQLEFHIPYIEKALGKPNKNIVTEEEIIKIELIKKVTIDSIKHLSKNTNFIDRFDQDSGDVIPKKILNSYKEETFITYENRFIYTLIKLIDDFIYLRNKAEKEDAYKGKNYKKAVYTASTKLKKEKIKMEFEYYSEITEPAKKEGNVKERIEKLQESLKMLKATEMYQLLDSKRIILVKAPLKMTNVLLKNVNFQYCVKLWNYLSDQLEMNEKSVEAKSSFLENSLTKKIIDECFYIEHVIFNSKQKNNEEKKKANKSAIMDKSIQKELTDKLIEQIININSDLSENEMYKMINDKYIFLKKKEIISLKPVEERFKKKFDKYFEKIKELRLK